MRADSCCFGPITPRRHDETCYRTNPNDDGRRSRVDWLCGQLRHRPTSAQQRVATELRHIGRGPQQWEAALLFPAADGFKPDNSRDIRSGVVAVGPNLRNDRGYVCHDNGLLLNDVWLRRGEGDAAGRPV